MAHTLRTLAPSSRSKPPVIRVVMGVISANRWEYSSSASALVLAMASIC
jgi:hypothetical protein